MAKFQNLVGTIKDRLGKKVEKDLEIADATQDAFASKPISRAQAKRDLEARIAEKLAKMSNSDLEELFILQQRQLEADRNGEIAITSLDDLGLAPSSEPVVESVAEAAVDSKVESEPIVEAEVEKIEAEAEPEVSEVELEIELESETKVSEIEIEVVEAIEIQVEEPQVELEPEVVEAEEQVSESDEPVAETEVAEAKTEFEVAEVNEPEAELEEQVAEADDLDSKIDEFYKGFEKAELEAEISETETKAEVAEIETEEQVAEVDDPEAELEAEVSEIEEATTRAEEQTAETDDDLASKVDEFYKGFEEAEAEAEKKPIVSGDFKERFLIGFDYFASGAMLEAGSKKCNSFFNRVSNSIAFLKSDITYNANRIFSVPAKPFIRFGTFVSKHLKTKDNISEEKRQRKIKRREFFARGEQAVSNQMANFVTALDTGTGILAKKSLKAIHRSSKRAHAIREWADIRKKYLLTVLFVLMLCGITAVSVVNYFTAYIYAYNGKPLGMVKSQHDVLRVLDIVNTQLSREHGTYIAIDPERDLTFYRVVSTTVNSEIDDMQDVFNRLTYMQDISTVAYAFYIEGRRMAVLDSEETIQGILSDYINLFLINNSMGTIVFDEIGFLEDVSSRPIDTQLGRLNHASDILDRIRAGTMTEQIHVVERGQTFSGIAVMHGVTQAELRELNPTVTPARLSIGQEIILQQAVPLLTIHSVETSTFIEPIPYGTIYEDNPNAFVGERSTRIAGIPGERQVTARITRQNGIEVDRVDLLYNTISEPSDAVVIRGTRPVPPRQGTGRLIRPLPAGTYRLSSPFGMRWGRMHNGVDWAAPRGTRVGAADGGTVTFSGYRGAFGNLIIINHGGGIETYYAHLNRRLVRTGEQVFQGQHIGDVGSTGRSTGPHLHFEVRVHGVPQNPLRFL